MPTIAYSALVLRRPFSGVEKSVAELARALLARRAYDYRLLLPPGAGPFLPATAGQRLSAPVWCRNRAGRILHELTLLPRQVRRAGIDLFHAPAYVAPPRLPCPLVLSLYDLHVYTHPRFCTRANRLHYRARLPGSIRRAAAILVPSRATRDVLAARFPEAAAKTHVIPLGVAPAYFEPGSSGERDRVRARYGLPARFLLSVGDPSPRKNPDGIRRAWTALRAAHPDLDLVLAGAPPRRPIWDSGRQEGARSPQQFPDFLSSLFKKYGDAPLYQRSRLHTIGYVDEADLPALYALAEALVFPSFDEGFGLPVLEAMAAGCPVVCSDGAAREFAGDAVRYCNPTDPGTLADALRPLLDDPALRQEMIACGRRQAADYTWASAAAATEAVYADCLR
jgi:glycosyltransferase involved in cell wall biosynthesis